MTILPDGSGQITGIIAEKWFALLLMETGIPFKWCGSDKGPYDFVIKLNGEAVKVDVKCKKRTVFASMTDEIVSFMGWCGKQEFWDSAKLVSKGEKDSQGFSERTGAGKIKYNQLRSMLNFLEIAKKQ